MSNQRSERRGYGMLAIAGAMIGFAACGESPVEPDPGPRPIIVELHASGTVVRDGRPIGGARVVLVRCDRMGDDGCEQEKTLAIAMTGRNGEYALDYTCECMPGEQMPEHSLLIEMPDVVNWDRIAGNRESRLVRLARGPDGEQTENGDHGNGRSGYFEIDPECVAVLIVEHDFALGD